MRILAFIFSLTLGTIHAQYAPAAGKSGSTALRGDSSCFVAWATHCNLQLGYMDISQPDSGWVSVGTAAAALGPAKQNGVVSLGDGGTATLSFLKPIVNGIGWDFAVFENSFLDTFLELAFVEVSTDGQRFVRFPCSSLTDTSIQTGAFGSTQPTQVNNLAGKYIVGYGTPFDLEEIKDSLGIDVNDIRYVRIRDVVGSLLPQFASYDAQNRKINDPWPTLFPSSGFDLDAVGVIHQGTTTAVEWQAENIFNIGPNPSSGILNIQSHANDKVIVSDRLGKILYELEIQQGLNHYELELPAGFYYISNPKTGWGMPWLVQNNEP